MTLGSLIFAFVVRSSSEEVEICLVWFVGNGDGVLITDLGVELEDELCDDDLLDCLYLRLRVGDAIELDDDRGDTGSGDVICGVNFYDGYGPFVLFPHAAQYVNMMDDHYHCRH